MSWWSRIANVFRADTLGRELDDELQFHLDECIRALVEDGMSQEEAAAQVRRRFGRALRLREESRDVKFVPWLDAFVRDVRLGVRTLRKDLVVTTTAIASLALALGACVAAFSLVDALMLRPLPVRAPDTLVYLAFPTYDPERPESETFNYPIFEHLRAAAPAGVDLFAMSTQVMRPARFDGPESAKEQVRAQHVSGDAFDRLGVVPALGRLLGKDDDVQPGAHPVAVLSHAFWMRRFGGDPAVIGRTFILDDRPLEIVGVATPRFTGVEPGRPTDVWAPMMMSAPPQAFASPQRHWFRIFGRRAEHVPPEQVHGVLEPAFMGYRRELATHIGQGRPPETVARFADTPLYVRSAANGPSPLRRQFERPLWILAAIAGLVLLVAGSNVANVFLARTASREREMSLRVSIGAGRGRLIQQVLVESALVAGVACVLGLLVAHLVAPAVVGMLAPPSDPVALDLRRDWRVLACAGALTLVITMLFGLTPALRASGVAPVTALASGGARTGTRTRVMRPFVAAQVAFSLVVLFVGGLLVLSFARLSNVHPGFATSDVLLVSVEPTGPVDVERQRAVLFDVLDRLRAVPGVGAASSAEFNLLGRAWTHGGLRVPGTEHEYVDATMAPVTDGFFETMGIPVLDGRPFRRSDMTAERATAVMVNQAFADRYVGRGERVVGRTFETCFFGDCGGGVLYEIVGVVADTRYDLRKPAAATLYLPIPLRTNGMIHVRATGDAQALAPRLREEVDAVSPLLRVTSITQQSTAVAQTLLRERLLALLSGFFALVGLVLAAIGLYGVLSYSVVQRTREVGIRLALGARQFGIIRAIVADAGIATLTGMAAGLAGGLYLSGFVTALLFEVTPLDVWSLALPVGTLLLAAALAAVVPAWRATRVDPVVALRHE